MQDKFLNFSLNFIHLCQKMSIFSYREVSQSRLENIGPSLEGADVTIPRPVGLGTKLTPGKNICCMNNAR